MAVLTLVPVDPIAVIGNLRRRTYTISGTISNGDTATISEFNSVIEARFVGGTGSDVVPVISGTGNRTVTFGTTVADITGGRLTVEGF